MDETKEYQEMLKAAPEIQELWEPYIGDYHLWNGTVSIISTETFKSHTGYEIRDRFAWGDENVYGEYIAGYFKDHVIMEFPVKEPFDYSIIGYFQKTYIEYDGCSWLPRQDQLQDMLNIDKLGFNLISQFVSFSKGHIRRNKGLVWTMEQLWLAFVMSEKFSKKWNGKEWV